jgi:hypothetical protein
MFYTWEVNFVVVVVSIQWQGFLFGFAGIGRLDHSTSPQEVALTSRGLENTVQLNVDIP